MTRVVDANVVIPWYVEDEGSEAACQLIGASLVAPSFLLTEVGNIVWKKVKRKEIVASHALAILAEVEVVIPRIADEPHHSRALEIALTLAYPVYDCLYLALAEALGIPLVTADVKLWNRCKGSEFEEMIESLTSPDALTKTGW